MVAPGDQPALRRWHDRAPDPHCRSDALRRAGGSEAAGVEELMERAGAALAEASYRFAGPMPALVLCGPGNNGGDGYVAARHLAARGVDVRVAALAEPTTDAAQWARIAWDGPSSHCRRYEPAPLLIDCLFGTGLKRGLEDAVVYNIFSILCAKAALSDRLRSSKRRRGRQRGTS